MAWIVVETLQTRLTGRGRSHYIPGTGLGLGLGLEVRGARTGVEESVYY